MHHLDDRGEEIGIHDLDTRMVSSDLLEGLLQQGVVAHGYLVEIFEAPGAWLVARRIGTREEHQVRRRASQWRDPGNDDGLGSLLDECLLFRDTGKFRVQTDKLGI